MPRPARTLPIALVCLAAAAAVPAARAEWTRVSGPVPPPVSEFSEHDGRWFLGTNFADSGDLFASDDAGATWFDVGLPNGGVSLLFPFGTDLYLGAYLSGLFRSTDNGDSWQEVGGPFASGSPGAMVAVDASTLIAGFDNFFDVPMQRSTDAGATWNTIGGGPSLRCHDLALVGSAVLAGGVAAGVQRSTDGGVTWAPSSTGLPAGVDTYRFAIDGTDVYLAAGGNGNALAVYRSTDSGATWTQVSVNAPNGGSSVTALFVHAGDLYLGNSGTFGDRGLYRSTNGGVNWTKVTTSLAGDPSIGAAAALGGTLLAGTFDGAFRTTDAGATWTDTWHGSSGVFGSQAMIHSFGPLFVAVDAVLSGGSGIVSTTDDGVTWPPVSGVPAGGTAYDFLEHGGSLFAAVYGGIRGVYVSTDGGATFAITGSWAPGVVLRCLHAHGSVLLAGSSDAYFRSTDDGATWTSHTTLGWVEDFASLDGLLYAGRYPGGVSRSSDGGLTWTALSSGMPGAPHINALAVFDGAVYAAVNTGSVMRWTGTTWIDAGLGGDFVDELLPVGGTLLAGTAFNHVFLSTDGAAWIDFSDGFTGGIIESMAVTPDRVIVGTRGRGIWSRPRAELPAPTAVTPAAAAPSALRLAVFPNPSGASATVTFDLPRDGAVTLDVLDVTGRRVRRLLAAERPAGRHGVVWNGRDERGRLAGNGVYFLRARTADGDAEVTKIMRVR